MPPALIEEVRPRIQLSRVDQLLRGRPPAEGATRGRLCHEPAELSVGGMRLGARVRHGKFGEGVVLNIEGQGRTRACMSILSGRAPNG